MRLGLRRYAFAGVPNDRLVTPRVIRPPALVRFLIDGDKRLALAAVIAFYGLNGRRLTFTNDQAYDLVMKVAAGELDQVEEITAFLQNATAPRR